MTHKELPVMPLALAIKNRNAIIIASDVSGKSENPSEFGQFMPVSDHAALLVVGNLEAVRHAITNVLPKAGDHASAAELAQYVQAAMTVEIVPKMSELKGRVEIIVAGFDPIRHVQEPSLYYMDSAQDFYLKIADTDVVAAGATAAVTSLLSGHSFADANTEHLKVLAKECLAATKLRWPEALKPHIRLGVITQQMLLVSDY